MREFADCLISILSTLENTVQLSFLSTWLSTLKSLVPNQYQDTFVSMLNKGCLESRLKSNTPSYSITNMSNNQQKEINQKDRLSNTTITNQKRRQSELSPNTKIMTNIHSSQNISVIQSQASADDMLGSMNGTNNQNSKRARLLLAQVAVKAGHTKDHLYEQKDSNSVMKKLELIELKKNGIYEKKENIPISDLNNTNDKAAKLMCCICKDIAKIPFAARCGHICCRICWEQMLKSSRECLCPMCRKPTTASELTQLFIR